MEVRSCFDRLFFAAEFLVRNHSATEQKVDIQQQKENSFSCVGGNENKGAASGEEGYEDSWYVRSLKEKPLSLPSVKSKDLEADVCVIGGGLAGVCTALGLVERGKSVIVVESKRIGWGASGRNGGMAIPGFQIDQMELVERHGEEKARHLYDLTLEAYHLLRKRIDQFSILCDPQDEGELYVSCFPETKNDYEEQVSSVNRIFGPHSHFWPASKVREFYQTKFYHHGVFSKFAFSVNPLALTIGLGRAASQSGALLFERTRAVSLDSVKETNSSPYPNRQFRIGTQSDFGSGAIYANQVVLATNYDPANQSLNRKVARHTLPIYTYIVVTKPLLPKKNMEGEQETPDAEEELRKIIKSKCCVCDDRLALGYFRPLPGGRLLWGGFAEPYPLKDKKILTEKIMKDLSRVFPQMSKAEPEVVWGGQINFGRRMMPLIGQVSPGIWYCTGFGGHGLVPTTMGGELIASAIAQGDERWHIFRDEYPLQTVGWPFHQMAAYFYWKLYSVCDSVSLWKINRENEK